MEEQRAKVVRLHLIIKHSMILGILFTLFLVFLNGFFVAAEFAIVKVRASQIEILIKAGSSTAVVAKSILNKLDAYLSATQFGITLASLGLGFIGEEVVAEIVISLIHTLGFEFSPNFIHQISIVIAFSLITIMHIVFGELAPKSLAIQRSESTVLAIAYPLRVFYWVFRPAIWVLNGLANIILKTIGITPIHGETAHSPEELRLLVEQGKEEGTMEGVNYEIIKNAFDFSERTARQVMVSRTRVVALNADQSDEQLVEKIIEEGFSRMPVYRDSLDNIIGIIFAKDVFAMLRKKQDISIKSIIRPIHFVPQNQRITKLLSQFQRDRIHMAVVVDEYGGTEGIITMEDIIEELVGEIQDEYDNEAPIFEKISDDNFKVVATASIADLNEYLPHPLTESKEYESLAGLLTFNLGRIPKVDEKIVLEDYEFTILNIVKNNIGLVQIRDLAEAD